MESKRVLIDIKKLNLEGGTQHRTQMDEAVVLQYMEAMLDGDKFPPVEAVYDGKHYWLWDGFTRTEAAKRAGERGIAVNIRNGTQSDAFELSLLANATHGQARSNADKRNVVTAALQEERFAALSSRELARKCGVSHTLVDDLRSPKDRTIRVAKVAAVATPGPVAEGEEVATAATKPDGEVATAATSGPNHDAEPGDVTVKKPGVVPKGSLAAITAERDALRDQHAELVPLLEERLAYITELEAGIEIGDVEKAALAENKVLRERIRVLEESVRGLLNEKNEAIGLAKHWKRKADTKTNGARAA